MIEKAKIKSILKLQNPYQKKKLLSMLTRINRHKPQLQLS